MKIINLKQGMPLAPRLKEVLDLVYAKRPLLEYEVAGYSDNRGVETVNVWQDGQKVGNIFSSHQRYSPTNGTTEMWYALESDNIKKSRGDRDTKYCKNAKVAARTAIEAFTKKPLAELGKRLISNVKYAVESMCDSTERAYQNSVNISALELAKYFTDVAMGNNPPMPKRTVDSIVSNEALRKRENYEIARNVFAHLKANNGYAIRVMQDETLLCAHIGNPDTTSKHQSTYELDQYTQEKFTMLKLLDMNQFAADVGIKYESDDGVKKETIYFIVAGETKVM
jgi:hypothetical protein